MFTAADFDPVFFARLRSEEPSLWPNHLRLARIAHQVHSDELAAVDAELEVLAARRREMLDHLARLRPRLWPESHRRHVRRRCRVDERALPPAVVGAELVGGVELRQLIVGLLRRHGDVSLRELHGLIHRYGYAVAGDRPVQRLGDAAAYEVRAGRLHRVARGVYGPAPADDVDAGLGTVPTGSSLPWDRPGDDDPPPVDPSIAVDPERWSDQRWPADVQRGGDTLPPPPDPALRSLGDDLTTNVAAARHRLAALVAARHRPSPPPIHDSATLGDDSSTNRDLWTGSGWWGRGASWGESPSEEGRPGDR